MKDSGPHLFRLVTAIWPWRADMTSVWFEGMTSLMILNSTPSNSGSQYRLFSFFGTLYHQAKNSLLVQTHCVTSPLFQKYWGIKLIWVGTADARWWRLFCPVLPYGLLQQRMSCWLCGDAVVSAVWLYQLVHKQDPYSQGKVEIYVHDGKNKLSTILKG